jgi:hypothetical protein
MLSLEILKIAAILQTEPFYGLLSKKQWNELQSFCKGDELHSFWMNKKTFLENLYKKLLELFPAVHADFMKAFSYLKYAPVKDPQLKEFLSHIKLEKPLEKSMELPDFKRYMLKNPMFKRQKTAVMFAYPYATPTVDYNAIPRSQRTQTHYPEEQEMMGDLVQEMDDKIHKEALEPAYFNMPYAEPSKEFHKIPVGKRTRTHYPEDQEILDNLVTEMKDHIKKAAMIPIWPFVPPALKYDEIPDSARTQTHYPEENEMIDNVVEHMQHKIKKK